MSPEDEERLAKEVDEILDRMGIEEILECLECGCELTLKTEVIPGEKPELSRIAYNCHCCHAMNVVWNKAGIPRL